MTCQDNAVKMLWKPDISPALVKYFDLSNKDSFHDRVLILPINFFLNIVGALPERKRKKKKKK